MIKLNCFIVLPNLQQYSFKKAILPINNKQKDKETMMKMGLSF